MFHEVKKLYQSYFDEPKLREIVLSCDKGWLFHIVVKHHDNLETFSALNSFLIELFRSGEKSEKFKDFFLFEDTYGRTIFMEAAERYDHTFFESLLNLYKELCPGE